MDLGRDLQGRLALGGVVVVLLGVVAFAAVAFIRVAVFVVFLYYAVRPIFRFLEQFGLGRRLRAVLSLLLFGLPFVVLIAYTVAIIGLEIQRFLDTETADRVIAELNVGGLDLDALEELATGGDPGSVGLVAESLLSAVSLAGSILVQLLLVVIGAYYLLVDGPRLVSWFLETYDESGIGRSYVDGVDPELSQALFGNIVNIFITAILGLVTFLGYNALAPETVSIPFPALLAALAGIGSLIPVIGIKLVNVPLVVGLAAKAWLSGDLGLLVPVAALLVVSAVFVDFVPDFFTRAKVSSDETHTGLLLIVYIVGPSVFGFYGLFFAPIVLICTTNAVTILLPYVLFGDADQTDQRTLDSFSTDGGENTPADGDR